MTGDVPCTLQQLHDGTRGSQLVTNAGLVGIKPLICQGHLKSVRAVSRIMGH